MITSESQITVVGGVYREVVMWPAKNEIFGSAGRAACALAKLGASVLLEGYAGSDADEVIGELASLYAFDWKRHPAPATLAFFYTYGTATPAFDRPSSPLPTLVVHADQVVRYGMLESDAVVHARRAVYDPQDSYAPQTFTANGSTADELAVVLNEHEARLLVGAQASADAMAQAVAQESGAQVVVLKRGPKGALIWDRGVVSSAPAFETTHVFKVGSGDYFVAHFAFRWMHEGRAASDAAFHASMATAAYCQSGSFPSLDDLAAFAAVPLQIGTRWERGERPRVYLAGPFFNLAQMWMVDQARRNLREMGLRVFSPYHDVGPGDAARVVPLDLQAIRECDLVFAIVDGLDAGTVYEIGHARALGKPVVVYSENEPTEPLKMMAGSDCFMVSDFVSAIYRASWVAIGL